VTHREKERERESGERRARVRTLTSAATAARGDVEASTLTVDDVQPSETH